MPGSAPAALMWLAREWEAAIPSAVFSGIVSSQAPYYGYHHGRAYLPSGDYSRQLAEDKLGSDYDASAIDMSMSPADMKLVTGRLIRSADDPNDPRLNVCREFYGTVDGTNVVGRDTYYGRFASSDSTHLWHDHVSVLRAHCNDYAAMRAILSVVTGGQGDDDMAGEGPEILAIARELQAHTRRQRWLWLPTKAQWVAAGGNALAFDALGDDVMIKAIKDAADLDADELASVHAAAKAGGAEGVRGIADELVQRIVAGLPPELGEDVAAKVSASVDATVRKVFGDAATPDAA